MIVSTALLCLAINTYHEARGEPILGRYAVAKVTMNRAQDEKSRVCKEVFRHKQFSWTTKVRKVKGGWYVPEHLRPKDEVAWWYAKRIAQHTLNKGMPADFMQGADHYHASYVSPGWAKSMYRVKKIGLHIFYIRKA